MASRSQKKRVFCPHCQQFVGYSTFYRHRGRFYDHQTSSWTETAVSEEPKSVNEHGACTHSRSRSRSSGSKSSSRSRSSSRSTNGSEGVDSTGSAHARLPPSLRDHLSSPLILYYTDEQDFSYDHRAIQPQIAAQVHDGVSEVGMDSDFTDSDSSNESNSDSNSEFWPNSSDSDTGTAETAGTSSPTNASVRVFCIFISMWHALFSVSANAINCLLKFIKIFLMNLGNSFQMHKCIEVSAAMPSSLQAMHKSINVYDNFISYVVCPTCSSIYEYNDCVTIHANGSKESKRCCHVKYPKHPQARCRQSCNTTLLKKVNTKCGYSLKAKKVFPFMPLKTSIERIISRNGVLEICEKWRERQQHIPDSYLGDIYDGEVWKAFGSEEYQYFLTFPHCLMLTLNVDWFEPFERGIYAVGAIYLTILNLPRSIRYKQENIILVGIIPGPKEPKLTVNSYLTPLILDLKEGWITGFDIHTCLNNKVRVRVALMCVTCDIPASRKVCGFLGHNAALGCNKCLKKFNVDFGSRSDYSGFDRDNWNSRNLDDHRQRVKEVCKEKTKTGIQAAESKYGVRYSALLSLPYFDPIKFTAIDVMHNLFLGTGKHMLDLWMDKNILDREDLLRIESLVNKFCVPSDIGRLPTNISSGYGGFTANQWRNWISIYSPVILKGMLPRDDLQCWLLYVRACSILCSRFLRISDVDTADAFLLQFCRKCEGLYGRDACTPNMHLHLHLKESFLHFGPPHAFWCFAFERFNGVLGAYHTNNRAIEEQLMRKFCREQTVQKLELPPEISILLKSNIESPKNDGNTNPANTFQIYSSSFSRDFVDSTQFFYTSESKDITLLPPFKKKILSSHLLDSLKLLYRKLYPSTVFPHISPFYDHYGRITLGGDIIGSSSPGRTYNNAASSVVMAYWPKSSDFTSIDYSRMQVGIVQYFLKHETTVKNAMETRKVVHIFAYVNWKQHHPNVDWFGISSTVCLESDSCSSFMPIQRIACRCAHVLTEVNFDNYTETVFIACPVPIRYSL